MIKENLPDFDENGNIPSGCHICHINEFKKKFVDSFTESKSRQSRFDGFLDYSRHICINIDKKNKFVINGSYTTTKNNPHDIDFLIVFNALQLNEDECEFSKNEFKKQKALNKQRHIAVELAKRGLIDINDVYCCDWYPLYQRDSDDEKYDDYLADKDYWLDCWGTSRKDENGEEHPKGFIILELDLKLVEELNESS